MPSRATPTTRPATGSNGTLTQGQLVASGRPNGGSALQVTKVGYADLGNPPSLDFGTTDWTVTAWFKTSMTGTGDANKGTIYGKGGDTAGGHRYCLIMSETVEGVVTLVTDDDVTKYVVDSKSKTNNDEWHFVAGQRAGHRPADLHRRATGRHRRRHRHLQSRRHQAAQRVYRRHHRPHEQRSVQAVQRPDRRRARLQQGAVRRQRSFGSRARPRRWPSRSEFEQAARTITRSCESVTCSICGSGRATAGATFFFRLIPEGH